MIRASFLSLREKIGQMLMVGFDGPSLSRETGDRLKGLRAGGVILFERNCGEPHQLMELCSSLQALASGGDFSLPLWISVDQEGGRVRRLKEPFTQFPSAGLLGSLGREDVVYRVSRAMAAEMAAVGINMNLAPVLDVNTNPDNPVIGDRSYGDDPDLVSAMGRAFLRGHRDEGVMAVGKHFPGHGDTGFDSHLTLGRVQKGADLLRSVELKPFRAAVREGLDAIMTAHVIYDAFDPENPATTSHMILGDLLRGEMGFRGMIITDDMEMRAVSSSHAPGDAALASVAAGCDMVLISSGRGEEVRDRLLKAVSDGNLSEKRVDEAVERLITLKERYISQGMGIPPRDRIKLIGCEGHRGLVGEVQRLWADIT